MSLNLLGDIAGSWGAQTARVSRAKMTVRWIWCGSMHLQSHPLTWVDLCELWASPVYTG